MFDDDNQLNNRNNEEHLAIALDVVSGSNNAGMNNMEMGNMGMGNMGIQASK